MSPEMYWKEITKAVKIIIMYRSSGTHTIMWSVMSKFICMTLLMSPEHTSQLFSSSKIKKFECAAHDESLEGSSTRYKWGMRHRRQMTNSRCVRFEWFMEISLPLILMMNFHEKTPTRQCRNNLLVRIFGSCLNFYWPSFEFYRMALGNILFKWRLIFHLILS